jgi:hypothetical protein
MSFREQLIENVVAGVVPSLQQRFFGKLQPRLASGVPGLNGHADRSVFGQGQWSRQDNSTVFVNGINRCRHAESLPAIPGIGKQTYPRLELSATATATAKSKKIIKKSFDDSIYFNYMYSNEWPLKTMSKMRKVNRKASAFVAATTARRDGRLTKVMKNEFRAGRKLGGQIETGFCLRRSGLAQNQQDRSSQSKSVAVSRSQSQ